MEPLAILETFDRVPEDEAFVELAAWIHEVAAGRAQYEEDGEHLVQETSTRFPTRPVRDAIALALALAEMRMDLALSESYGEASGTITAHKRKIELLELLLSRELEQL